jgi:hypothetical protein
MVPFYGRDHAIMTVLVIDHLKYVAGLKIPLALFIRKTRWCSSDVAPGHAARANVGPKRAISSAGAEGGR